jgi:hypothetical protein
MLVLQSIWRQFPFLEYFAHTAKEIHNKIKTPNESGTIDAMSLPTADYSS